MTEEDEKITNYSPWVIGGWLIGCGVWSVKESFCVRRNAGLHSY